jgi:hypothetical protein
MAKAQVMGVTKADWEIFDDAIGIIEKQGWTNQPNRGHGVCLWIAISRAAYPDPTNSTMEEVESADRLSDLVTNHFGKSSISEVFILNDKQPDEAGKHWAIMNLADLRDRAIRELAISEKPFPVRIFIRLWNVIRRKK